jgi:hypothetical protein
VKGKHRASQPDSLQKMGDKEMQKTLNSQPAFRWQQQNMDSLLYCGSVLIAKLRFCGRDNGLEHYRIENATFPDTLSEVGSYWWDGQPFALKERTFKSIASMVEEFYTAVFEKLNFTLTIV